MRRPAAALAVLAVIAGCGSDPLSASEYRQKAERICEDSRRQAQAIEQPTRPTPAAIADFLRRQQKIADERADKLRKLEPPKGLKRAHDTALEANAKLKDEVGRVTAQLDEGEDPSAVLARARPELQRLSDQRRAAAKSLGVAACTR